jgi:Flp pilus assembly protein TadD
MWLFGSVVNTTKPADPEELHNLLFRQATELAQPYLLLLDVAAKNAKSVEGRADLGRAIALFDRVLGINPENWVAAWFVGKIAQSVGDLELAYRYFKRSFDIEKKNPDVARELTVICLDTKRAKEAVAVAEFAVGLSETDAGLKANLALARLCAGDPVGADDDIDAALRLDSRDEINVAIKKYVGQVRRGERKIPETPGDLLK